MIQEDMTLRDPSAKVSGLVRQIECFLEERRARQLSSRSLDWYDEKLQAYLRFAIGSGCGDLLDASPGSVRSYLLHLQSNHNAGGVHGHYRALRALLNWYEQEYEPAGWKNPMRKVRAPKVPSAILEPVPLSDIQRMLSNCCGTSLTALRDRALLLFLLDTGTRAQECLDMSLGDVSLETGACQVLHGKGGKARVVFLCGRTRDELRTYLDARKATDPLQPLWTTVSGTRLRYAGLREIVRRRARQAGVPAPSLHSFRRAFALNCLRQGMDVYSLQRLMGHSDLTILRRYLAQTPEDLRRAHEMYGPVAGAFREVALPGPEPDDPAANAGEPVRMENLGWN